jgi:hypothetical protein
MRFASHKGRKRLNQCSFEWKPQRIREIVRGSRDGHRYCRVLPMGTHSDAWELPSFLGIFTITLPCPTISTRGRLLTSSNLRRGNAPFTGRDGTPAGAPGPSAYGS